MPYLGNTAGNRFVASKAATQFSGNGSNTSFTLEHAVGSDEDILVSVDGVIQEPSVAYTVSNGTTLTFTAAPSNNSGNNIFVYYLFRTVGTVSHPSNNALSATSGTFTGNVVIPDGGNIGSASDTDAMAISSGGAVTFSQIPVFSAGGVGKVLQVVNAVTTGSSNSQSTTEVVYQTVSITPASTSSKILVGAEGAGSVICGSNGILQCNLYRGGTSDTLIARFYSGLGSTTNGHEHYITGSCLVVDSPSTTSAQTYTFSGQKGSGGTTSARLMAGSDFPIVMFAIEIGP